MKTTTIDLPDNFEKGMCYDCPFSYTDSDDIASAICIFHCRYDECPLEIIEPCEDTVSREAVLDIVCGVYKKDGWGESNFYKAIKALPSVTLKPIEYDDAISRDAVIGKVKELFSMGECYCDEHSIIGMINKLPSVTVRQTGCDKCAMNGSGSKYCDNCKYKRQTGEWSNHTKTYQKGNENGDNVYFNN